MRVRGRAAGCSDVTASDPVTYTAIIPRVDRNGPCSVAVDLCKEAMLHGARVRLLALSPTIERDDVSDIPEVRQFRVADLFTLRGIVHTHCLRPDLLGGLLALRRKCVVVTTIHNCYLRDVRYSHSKWVTRLSFGLWSRSISRMAARITVSAAMARYYGRLIPNRSFDVAYNFRRERVPSTSALPAEVGEFIRGERAAGRVVMVFVGRLSEGKNVLALAEHVVRSRQLAVVMCGDGPLRQELESVVGAGGARHVWLAGMRDAPEGIVSACDMLVLPSFTEGLPLVVLEALMCGRPALMSSIAVHRELAAKGAGLTFDHHAFTDCEQRAVELRQIAAAAGEQRFRTVYRSHFAGGSGFARYRQVFARYDRRWEQA